MYSNLASESSKFLREKVAAAMDNYELRPSQAEMMAACADIIENSGVLMAEAGTGTGKTFAYLIPLVLSGKKTIISTRTINLQEQLVSKDLAFLSTLIEFDYAIAKGRSNYLCLRRLDAFRADNDEEEYEIRNLVKWASSADSGDMERYVFKRSVIWDRVCSDADACKGMKCAKFKQCFYFRARQRWDKADIVVANHALTVINSMLMNDSKILPHAEVLVIDEGHAIDNVISDQAGINISNRGFDYILNKLLRTDSKGAYKGILSKSPHLYLAVESLRTEMGLFWVMVKNEFRDRQTIRGAFKLGNLMINHSASINKLVSDIRQSATGLFQEDEELELKAAILKLSAFADSMEVFPEGREGNVRWSEMEERRTAFRMSPVYPREFVRDNIVSEYESVILTSATLSVAGDFGLTVKTLGLEDSQKITVASPFDLRNQTEIKIKKGIDFKNDDGSIERLAEVIIAEASRKDGGVLVLFTSRDVMNKTWGHSVEALSDMGLTPMLQGEMPNRMMLDIMREGRESVIFGLDSFWEGVDVQGDSLKCLIITKLPFEVPTEPITMARTEDIERNGGNPFYEYSLPRAIIKFRQGFGRLIRSGEDSGRVIICDERIETKAYGKKFMKSLF